MAISTIKNNYASTDVTANYLVPVAGASRITAKRTGNILIVSGYINSDTELSSNTYIARINATPIFESFCSPYSSGGTGARLTLRTDGRIQLESALHQQWWYSFTFITFIN